MVSLDLNDCLIVLRVSSRKGKSFYYIKVSGIPSGNKLIKTIRYPTREDMISLHVKISMILLLSSLSLKLYLNSLVYHLRVFLESFRQSSEILRKCSGTFVWPSEQF